MHNLTPPAMPVRVFTLQLGWEKEREDSRDIRDTIATITQVRIQPHRAQFLQNMVKIKAKTRRHLC
jgi:hypothetical protein